MQTPQTPLPLPFHTIPNLPNFRDIGGWPISPRPSTTPPPQHARHVRRNTIYRGSDPTRLPPHAIAHLTSLNITRTHDLRSAPQIEKAGGIRALPGIERVWTPVFKDTEATTEEERTRERYEAYASEGTSGIVGAFIEILMEGRGVLGVVVAGLFRDEDGDGRGRGAVYIHCTTGNNRTGVFVAVLLLLLRVPREVVVHEYVLSEMGMAATRHVNVARLLAKGAFAECGVEEARRRCERMVGARAESMEGLIDEVTGRWGEYGEGYFREVVGLSVEEIERLRRLMTVEGEGYMI